MEEYVVLHCKTTEGVVEQRFKRNADKIIVRLVLHRRSASHHIVVKLADMGLTEVPSDLFQITTVRYLRLYCNQLCSLPSQVGQLTRLVTLDVRHSKRLDRA
jgi:hypothetical protein